jgi:citrate synthase
VVSHISFIDGEKGILRYRGFPIEQLAERAHFLEVAHCVVFGDLPTQPQLDIFQVCFLSIKQSSLVGGHSHLLHPVH